MHSQTKKYLLKEQQDFLDQLRQNDQQWFDDVVNSFTLPHHFGEMVFVVLTDEGVSRSPQVLNNDKYLFFNFIEDWLLRQSTDVQHDILIKSDNAFCFEFLNRPNIETFLKQIDCSIYYFVNHNDYNRKYSKLNSFAQSAQDGLGQKMWHVIDLILQQSNMTQQFNSCADILHFINVVFQDNGSYASKFLDRMQEHFAPQWVSLFFHWTIKNNNHQLCQDLCQRPLFQQWLTQSRFPEIYLRNQTVHQKHDLNQFQTFFQHFDHSTWKAVVQYIASAHIQTEDGDMWADYVRQQLSSNERVQFVQKHLRTLFAKEDYSRGALIVSEQSYNKNVSPWLNCLHPEDYHLWVASNWLLDDYFRVHEHPVMVNALLTQETQHSGSTSFVRKM